MIKLDKNQLLKRAKQIKAIKGHRYLQVEDVSLSRIDTAIKSNIKTPKLIKLGGIEVQVYKGYGDILRIFSTDIVDQIPDDLAKDAVAFKILQRSAKFDGRRIQTHVPMKVNVYGLAEGAKVPNEIDEQGITFAGQKYSAQEIDSL